MYSAKRIHCTTRKAALVLSPADYTAACARKFDEGVVKSKEKYLALMAKYCPGVSATELEPIPARKSG